MELQRLREQQAELLAMVDGWPEARLAFRPSTAEWSAAEVFDHLERTEREILGVAKAGLERPHHLGARDRLGWIFLQKVFSTGRKVKVPASANAVLPGMDACLPDVLERWQDTRNALHVFHNALTPEQHRAGVFRHPVAGWMDMDRILGFFSVHMRHHAYQLERLRAASGHLAEQVP